MSSPSPESTPAATSAAHDDTPATAPATAAETVESSLFDSFGGHYSAKFDGVEVARFAPSNHWSDYANAMQDQEGFTYEWVPKVEKTIAWLWYVNEDGAVYDYDSRIQARDFPGDFPTAYATKGQAEAAADEINARFEAEQKMKGGKA